MRSVIKSLRDHALTITIKLVVGLVLLELALNARSTLAVVLAVAYWVLVSVDQARFMRMTHRERQQLDAVARAS